MSELPAIAEHPPRINNRKISRFQKYLSFSEDTNEILWLADSVENARKISTVSKMSVDIKPFWYFVGGVCLLYIFALLVKPTGGYRPYPGPEPAPIGPGGEHRLGPGGQHRLYGIEGFADGGSATFTMFGVDWCPHCVSAKPVFQSLGSTSTIAGKPVSFRYVNPEKDRAAAAGYEIDGYPTFYLEQAGQKMKYQGPRTKDGMLQFLQSSLA
jgi:hypothetical protein